ncbi:MAG TPA: hypothetical protein VF254_05585 [Gammaproteobacteria bacterium]
MRRFALAFNLLVFLLACVGMMVVFIGGEGYLPVLLVLLALATPVSLLMGIVAFGGFVSRAGFGKAAAAAWRTIPQWLAVTFWLGVALIFCGELALLITVWLAGEPPRLWQHLPLLAGLAAAVSYCLVDAAQRDRAAGERDQAANGPA